jgi:hypothetical protein
MKSVLISLLQRPMTMRSMVAKLEEIGEMFFEDVEPGDRRLRRPLRPQRTTALGAFAPPGYGNG